LDLAAGLAEVLAELFLEVDIIVDKMRADSTHYRFCQEFGKICVNYIDNTEAVNPPGYSMTQFRSDSGIQDTVLSFQFSGFAFQLFADFLPSGV
jgi:hypothetical protein